jgi:chaperonin GroES
MAEYKIIDRRGKDKFEEENSTPAPKAEAASTPAPAVRFEPLNGRILVLPDNEEKTRGSIILAGEEPMKSGTIIAVSQGYVDDKGKVTAHTVQVKDKILYGKWAGSPITLNSVDFLVMKEGEVFGRVHLG